MKIQLDCFLELNKVQQIAYLLAEAGADTAENGPTSVRNLANFGNTRQWLAILSQRYINIILAILSGEVVCLMILDPKLWKAAKDGGRVEDADGPGKPGHWVRVHGVAEATERKVELRATVALTFLGSSSKMTK